MQVKKKPCSCEDCNGALTFIYKRDGRDGYCRQGWLKKLSKAEPTTLKRSNLSRSQKPIAKQSNKRKKEDILYSTMRKVYLDQHPVCEIGIEGVCSKQRTNQIHHTYSGKDRAKYYLDTSTWKATEQNCHDWVHRFSAEAREMGHLK